MVTLVFRSILGQVTSKHFSCLSLSSQVNKWAVYCHWVVSVHRKLCFTLSPPRFVVGFNCSGFFLPANNLEQYSLLNQFHSPIFFYNLRGQNWSCISLHSGIKMDTGSLVLELTLRYTYIRRSIKKTKCRDWRCLKMKNLLPFGSFVTLPKSSIFFRFSPKRRSTSSYRKQGKLLGQDFSRLLDQGLWRRKSIREKRWIIKKRLIICFHICKRCS